MSKLSLIICTDIKNGIGKYNAIPWYNPVDLKNFKRLTTNNVVVMGRKTWDSLPIQPLPNRLNIIISKGLYDNKPLARNVVVFRCVRHFLQFKSLISAHNPLYYKEWFIIGGSYLYNYFLEHDHLLYNIYWTRMDMDYHCDVKIDYSLSNLPMYWCEAINDRTRDINEKMSNASYHYIKKIV